MATLVTTQPSTVTAVTLTTLADGATAAPIPLPNVLAFGSVPVAGVAMNQWSLTVSAPTAVTVNWSGVTVTGGVASSIGPLPAAGDAVVPAGQYGGLSDLYAIAKASDVALWSNQGSVGLPLNGVEVQAAYDIADAEIAAYFAGIYAMPLPKTPVLTRGEAVLVAASLYKSLNKYDTVQGGFGSERIVDRWGQPVQAFWASMFNYRVGTFTFPGASFVAKVAPSAIGLGRNCGFGGGFRRFGC